jgi:hypothetical protein
MASGTTGTLLNDAEIQSAREAAKRFFWIESAPALRKRAEELRAAGKTDDAETLGRVLSILPIAQP